MNRVQHTKETTQSPNNKANAKLPTNGKEIEKMTTDTGEKVTPSEISEVKVYIHEQINASRTELKAEISDVKTEVHAVRTELGTKFDIFQDRILKILTWVVGIVVATLFAVISLLAKTML